jgi:cell wall-associated NlpC family hydrolase
VASQQGESTVVGETPPIGRLGLSRYTVIGAILGGVLVAVAAVLAIALGHSRHAAARTPARAALSGRAGGAAGVSATQAAAGARVGADARRGSTAQASHASPGVASAHPAGAKSAGGAKLGAGVVAAGAVAGNGVAAGAVAGNGVAAGAVAEAPDPEEAKSFPAPATVHHSLATKPSKAAEEVVAPGAPSNAEVRAELKQMHAVERAAARQQAKTLSIVPGGDSIGGGGQLPIPQGVPEVVQRIIAGANAIADFPYVFGGGHASFVSNSYDCSGSVSYALAAGGLLSSPETSGSLESWGAPGPGKWITVYANAGHVYMYVNIGGRWMRYDTVGRSGVFASRWQPEIRSNAGFVARHWAGL